MPQEKQSWTFPSYLKSGPKERRGHFAHPIRVKLLNNWNFTRDNLIFPKFHLFIFPDGSNYVSSLRLQFPLQPRPRLALAGGWRMRGWVCSPAGKNSAATAAMNNVKKAGGRCGSFRVTNPNLREFLAECAGRRSGRDWVVIAASPQAPWCSSCSAVAPQLRVYSLSDWRVISSLSTGGESSHWLTIISPTYPPPALQVVYRSSPRFAAQLRGLRRSHQPRRHSRPRHPRQVPMEASLDIFSFYYQRFKMKTIIAGRFLSTCWPSTSGPSSALLSCSSCTGTLSCSTSTTGAATGWPRTPRPSSPPSLPTISPSWGAWRTSWWARRSSCSASAPSPIGTTWRSSTALSTTACYLEGRRGRQRFLIIIFFAGQQTGRPFLHRPHHPGHWSLLWIQLRLRHQPGKGSGSTIIQL